MKRRKVSLDSVRREVEQWLAAGPSGANEDLIAEMLHTAVELSKNDNDRGNLKILDRALQELGHAFEIFAPYRSVRKVSIFGSTRVREGDAYYGMAVELSRRLAAEGFMVITGAGDGIMQAGHEGAGRERSFGVNIELPFGQMSNRFIRDDP